jgi:hypothetical protein
VPAVGITQALKGTTFQDDVTATGVTVTGNVAVTGVTVARPLITTATALTVAASGGIYACNAAAGSCLFTLPSASDGLMYEARVSAIDLADGHSLSYVL